MSFEPDYISEDLANKDDWSYRKIYSDSAYIAMSGFRKEMLLGSSEKFVIYLKTKGEIYGDPISFPLTDEDNLKLYIKKESGRIVNMLPLNLTNVNLGELSCNFNSFTIVDRGVYNFEVKLNNIKISCDYQIVVK